MSFLSPPRQPIPSAARRHPPLFIIFVIVATGVLGGCTSSDELVAQSPAAPSSVASSAGTSAPQAPAESPSTVPSPSCPGAAQVLSATQQYLSSRGYPLRMPTIVGGSIRCVGPYVTAGVVSEGSPEAFRVLIHREQNGLQVLKTGTGPLCSADPADGVVVVPEQYLSQLNCIPRGG